MKRKDSYDQSHSVENGRAKASPILSAQITVASPRSPTKYQLLANLFGA